MLAEPGANPLSTRVGSARILAAIGSIGLGLAGCDAGTGAAAEVTVRDSAGVRVVESVLASGNPRPFAEVGAPDLTIGVVDGDPRYTFGFVTDVRTLPDGGVAVSDYVDLTVRLYDRSGDHLLTRGGRGGGPGEFGAIGIAGVDGDGVRLWDAINQRVTLFDTRGDIVESVTFQQEGGSGPYEVHRLSDGTYLSSSRYHVLDPLSDDFLDLRVSIDSLVLRRLDSSGLDLDTIVVAPQAEILREIWDAGGGTPRPVGSYRPFGAQTFWVAHDDGSSTTLSNTRVELIRRDRSGVVRLIARLPEQPRDLDPREIERLKQRRFEEVGSDQRFRGLIERVFDPALLPRTMPRVSALERDTHGNYWVAEFATLPEEVTEWWVFAPSGELLGRVSLPPRFVVHEIGEDHILGVWSDELDVPYVQRYPLVRLAGG